MLNQNPEHSIVISNIISKYYDKWIDISIEKANHY